MRLTELNIYPIKSLGGINLETNNLEQKGLQNDRRWMLIDENDKFLTIRKLPQFLFFHLSLKGTGFRVTYQNDSVDLPFEIEGDLKKARVWDDEVEVIVGDDSWNEWFSDHLNFKCRLVHFPQSSERLSSKKWSDHEKNVNLSDEHPLLVVGDSSLNDLNKKLDEPVTMKRFRPNLVFEGGEPYEEYKWNDFTIGGVRFKGLKPCTRCVVTTYNELTGEKGHEPLKTLNTQKINNKVIFGQHALAIDYGSIQLGDEIKVNNYKESPYERS